MFSSVSRLSIQDQVGLILSIQEGSPDSVRARELLWGHYLPMVSALACRLARRAEFQDDLRQQGAVALLIAVDRFEADLGISPSTYIHAFVKGYMWHWLYREMRYRYRHVGHAQFSGEMAVEWENGDEQDPSVASEAATQPAVHAYLMESEAEAVVSSLRGRKQEVLLLGLQGYRPAEIAARLGLSRPRVSSLLVDGIAAAKKSLAQMAAPCAA